MNDSLDGLMGAESYAVPDVREIIPETLPTINIPEASVRNRASKTALLSDDPASAVSNYQAMVAEGKNGTEEITKGLQKQASVSTTKMDFQATVAILSDPTLTPQQKQAAVEAASSSDFLKDSAVNLMSKNLISASQGEDVKSERARGNLADTLREMYDEQGKQQSLVNAHAASLRDMDAITAAEMVDLNMVVFGNNASVLNMQKGLAKEEGRKLSLLQMFKESALAGNSVQGVRERLASLPPAKRTEFTQTVLKAISAGSGTILFTDNQYAQMQRAQQIFEEGGYSGVEQFIDNVMPLLDGFGLKGLSKGISKAIRGGKPALGEAEAAARAAVNKMATEEGSSTFKPFASSFDKLKAKNAAAQTEKETFEQAASAARKESTPKLYYETSKLERNIEEEISRIEMNAVVARSNPASPASLIQQTNPEKARAIHDLVANSVDDVAAEALYGTTRVEAVVSDIFPKAGTESGRVTTKPENLGMVPKNVMDRARIYASDQYTPEELAQAVGRIKHDFISSTEIQMITGMGDFARQEGGGVRIGAVYSSPNGAWSSAEDAIAQTKLALRNRGILDSEITVMRKEGLEHVPVDLESVRGVEGNYLVKVDSFHEIDPTDVAAMSELDVKLNFFDRSPILVWNDTGSVSRRIFDASSMLHPTIVSSAITSTDRASAFEKFMLEIASGFSDIYNKLEKAEKAALDKYFREANQNAIKATTPDLVARGFSPEARNAIQNWRDFWDGHWFLENLDVIRTLNSSGFQLLDHANVQLFVKPIAKNGNITKVYDPAIDMVVPITRAEIDDLYTMNGNLARTRQPETINGDVFEHVIVRNTPTEYTRKFRDTDQVLNYREGYYAVAYKAPRFIDRVEKDAKGNTISKRAVAVARDTPTAKQFAEAETKRTGVEHTERADDRAMRTGGDDWWDVNSAQGRIAQRHRGSPLTTSSGLNVIGEGSFVVDPVESAIHAARSISDRTVTRPMLEAAKERFIKQYASVLPSDGHGGVKFPSKVGEIGAKGQSFTSNTADARTTWEYIRYLENGYINHMDAAVKGLLHATAEMLGNAGFGALQRGALSLAEGSVSGVAKGSVFMAYIAANPLRQWIVQTHQVMRTMAYNPTGWATGGIPKLMGEYLSGKGGFSTLSAEGKAFTDFLDSSGLLSAIDRQSLIRGTLAEAAGIGGNPLTKLVGAMRKIGFDVGEAANTIGHAAAVYDRYKRLGKNLSDPKVLEEAHSEVRALSWDMNFAGDMPYNQTSASVLLQFLQVPHKALLQFTNRRLDTATKLRLGVMDMVLWGTPAYWVSDMLGGDILPEDKTLREVLVDGLESMLLNHYFQDLAGTDRAGFDFSPLVPYDIGGWRKAVEAYLTGGFSALIDNSAIGGLAIKEGSRVKEAFSSAGRFFAFKEDIDPEHPEEFWSMLNSFASISSGWSNFTKGWAALEASKSYDKYGKTIDNSVGLLDAFIITLGFQDKSNVEIFAMAEAARKITTKHSEDVKKDIKEVIRYYAKELNTGSTDPAFIKAITNVGNFALRRYANDPVAMDLIKNELSKNFKSKDSQLLDLIIKTLPIPTATQLRDRLKDAPMSDSERQKVLGVIDDFEKARTPKESK